MARKSPFRLLSIELRKLSSPRSLDFFGNSHPKNEFTFVSKESHQTKIPTLIRFKKQSQRGLGVGEMLRTIPNYSAGVMARGESAPGPPPASHPSSLFPCSKTSLTIRPSREYNRILFGLCVYLSSNISAGFYVL